MTQGDKGELALLEGLWAARTALERQALSERHFGGRASVEAAEQMQALLTFVLGHARVDDGEPWLRLEQVVVWLAAAGSAPTLRSRPTRLPTLASETEPSPPLWPPEPASPRVESVPSMVRSVIDRVVSEVEDETLQSGKAPVRPAVVVETRAQ